MSPHNVAIYGGLTALATFDRTELFKLVISSSQFKVFLLAGQGKIVIRKTMFFPILSDPEPGSVLDLDFSQLDPDRIELLILG